MDRSALMDKSSCERLWEEYADRLLLYATMLVGDTAAAEDVLQGVFMRLLKQGEDLRPESEQRYLFRAVRNESLNAVRSRSRASRKSSPLFEREDSDPARAAEREDFRRRVESALGGLPMDQREAVALKIWGGLSIPEAAEVSGLTGKTFEHRYYRGLEELERRIGGRDEGA